MTAEWHVPASLGRVLKGLEFPAQQADLVAQAKENGADQGVLEMLGNMPNREYGSMADVIEAYGGLSA
jgi:hypothetical protein